MLHLIAMLDDLLEDPELIPDAIAHRRYVESGQRVQQAGGQPAQAPVAQSRLHVQGVHIRRRTADTGKRLAGKVGGPAVHRVLAELAAQHVLRRQVVDELRVGRIVRLGRPCPAVGQAVTYGHRQRPVGVGRSPTRPSSPLVTQVVSQITLEFGQRITRPAGVRAVAERHEPNVNPMVRQGQVLKLRQL